MLLLIFSLVADAGPTTDSVIKYEKDMTFNASQYDS